MNQKGFVKDIIIVILGVLVLVGGYFYFSKKPANAPAETSSQNQVTATNPAETTDWETYRNDKYGFEFKYPNKYEIEAGLNNAGFRTEDRTFSVHVNPNFGLEGVKKTGNKFYSISGKTVQADILIDDPQFYQGKGIGSTYIVLDFKNNSDDFVIKATYPGNNQEVGDEFDQIISTFKFTK